VPFLQTSATTLIRFEKQVSVSSQINLRREAVSLAERIVSSQPDVEFFKSPFQHLILNDAFTLELSNLCLQHFPSLSDDCWEFSSIPGIEIKARSTWTSEFDSPEGIVDAIRILNSAPILRAMSERFEIPKLMPDPYFTGGGLNCSSFGGQLDVHVDGNYHDASGMHRRMNAILYLNPSYQSEWGGEFGIYKDDGETLVKTVEPLHNRLVVFESHDKSYHGIPNQIRFPDDEPRRSIILYFYTAKPRPKDVTTVEEPHSALWKSKGFTDKLGNVTRDFT